MSAKQKIFLQKMKISGVRKESKPLLLEQCVLLWQQGHFRRVELFKLASHLTVNQPSAGLLKSHFPACSGTPLQACPQPSTAETSRSSTVCKCDHRWFSWQVAAGQVCCSKSKSNPGDQSPPELGTARVVPAAKQKPSENPQNPHYLCQKNIFSWLLLWVKGEAELCITVKQRLYSYFLWTFMVQPVQKQEYFLAHLTGVRVTASSAAPSPCLKGEMLLLRGRWTNNVQDWARCAAL